MAVLVFRDHGLSVGPGRTNKNNTITLAREKPRDLQDQAEKHQDDWRNRCARSRRVDLNVLCLLTAVTPLFPFLTPACPLGHPQHLPQALPGCWARRQHMPSCFQGVLTVQQEFVSRDQKKQPGKRLTTNLHGTLGTRTKRELPDGLFHLAQALVSAMPVGTCCLWPPSLSTDWKYIGRKLLYKQAQSTSLPRKDG